MKKLLSLLLAMAMVISMVPSVFATEGGGTVSGGTDVGLWADAEITDLSSMETTLAAGDSNGYIYTWVAEEDGNVSFAGYVDSDEEVPPEFDIIVYCGDTVASRFDESGASVDVVAGDKVYVQIVALPDENGAYPAMNISAWGNFTLPAGTESNPIQVEFAWNDEWTEATATILAPVGTTYYAVYAAGMMMSIDGGEAFVVQAAPRSPYIFSIVNEGEAEEEHDLKIWYPVGTYSNPEALAIGWNELSLAEGSDGYYYSWIAEDTGVLTAYIGSITEGVVADIIINNNTTYANKTLLADGVDNYGLEVSMDVNKGDEISIQVAVMPDDNWAIPAAEITWVSSFAYPAGSEMNPINVEFVWNDAWTEATATVVAPVGTTYYQTYGAGMLLTINGGEPIVLQSMNPRMPAIFTITNNGEAEAEYTLKLAYPAGNMNNPDSLVIGENTAVIEAGAQGYFYTWTAEADGTLTITMPEGNWTYVVNNLTTGAYGDTQWSDSDPVVNVASVEVAAGDELQIVVNTYDPTNPWGNPAGSLVINAAFAEKPVEPDYSIVINKQPESVVIAYGTSNKFTVDATNVVSYQWQMSTTGADGSWTKCGYTGNTTATLTVKAQTSVHGMFFRCALTAEDSTVTYTDAATLHLIVEDVVIGEQPNSVVVPYGEPVVLHVEAEGVHTYRWMISPNGVDGWGLSPYTGRGTDTMTTKALTSNHGMYFKCVMTDVLGNVTDSDVVTVRIQAEELKVTKQPMSIQIAKASTAVAEFGVACDGAVYYRWEMLLAGEGQTWQECGSSERGFLSSYLYVPVKVDSRNGMQVRCKFTNADGAITYSDPATITIAKFTAQPEDTIVKQGATATFYAPASISGRHMWKYSSDNGTTWNNASMTNSGYLTDTLTLTATSGRNNWLVKCTIKDDYGTVIETKAVKLTVVGAIKVTAQPTDQTGPRSEKVNFTVAANNVKTYQWQVSNDGGNTWTNATYTGNKTDSMSVSVLTSTSNLKYRCMLTSAVGEVVYTNAVGLSIAE